MVKPDDIVQSIKRSEKAKASDKFQEQLATQRQRVFSFSLTVVVLIEIAFSYFDVTLWLRIIVPIIWVGVLIHNNALLILHELWEINDQISGRKDEFRQLLLGQRPNNETD